jgi:copper resistance protein C
MRQDQLDASLTDMKRPAWVFAVAAALLALVLASPSVFAHAFPASEEPLVGSTVATAPSEAAIVFNAPIEALFSKLEVLSANGAEEAAAPPALAKDRRRLSVKLKPLPPGEYTVKWVAVAEDGHRTQGSYVFTVAPAHP